MEVGLRNRRKNCSKSLELAANDDLPGFIQEVEDNGTGIDEASFWYGRTFGSKKMGFEERTPLMIASLYGSTDVLTYILKSGKVDVNRACGADGATALHCAAAGGSWPSVEIVRLLIDASGDIHATDAFGNKPADFIAPCIKSSARKTLELLLSGGAADPMDEQITPPVASEKREYPIDVPLPDINNGIYGTDEFRMYNFKVNPCSRAYSHDWTECPFVHPGENARRRDPRKYQYTCVPCPDFKKGNCGKGDACEYAHGIFESWLHPAQYRTRLCKDETGCTRKVCFFAHKPDELRPVYASTGSGIPSPKSVTDVAALSPMSPISPSVSSPMWQSKAAVTPPPLQLPGSRLKASLSARDLELDLELEKIRSQQHKKRQQLIEEMAGLCSSPYGRIGGVKPTNLDEVFGSHLQLRSSYPLPARKPVPYGFDSSAVVAAAVMNSRSSAFAKRSQSFVDRPGAAYWPGISSPANTPSVMPSKLGDWGSPDGKLNWGFNDEEANKLRKSASFGIRSGNATGGESVDVSWVDSLVKDVPAAGTGGGRRRGGGGRDVMPNWIDQVYMEQEQMVAY